MRKATDMGRVVMVLLILATLVLSVNAMGAGDDCPPPSSGRYDENCYRPGDDEGKAGDDAPEVDDTMGGESGGTFGSLGGVAGSQLTLGILVAVGIIVGAVYLFMVGRNEEPEEWGGQARHARGLLGLRSGKRPRLDTTPPLFANRRRALGKTIEMTTICELHCVDPSVLILIRWDASLFDSDSSPITFSKSTTPLNIGLPVNVGV